VRGFRLIFAVLAMKLAANGYDRVASDSREVFDYREVSGSIYKINLIYITALDIRF
jgi:hypothetical protein